MLKFLYFIAYIHSLANNLIAGDGVKSKQSSHLLLISANFSQWRKTSQTSSCTDLPLQKSQRNKKKPQNNNALKNCGKQLETGLISKLYNSSTFYCRLCHCDICTLWGYVSLRSSSLFPGYSLWPRQEQDQLTEERRFWSQSSGLCLPATGRILTLLHQDCQPGDDTRYTYSIHFRVFTVIFIDGVIHLVSYIHCVP